MTRLAWQCISTYRDTDYLGGCNGARIRFSPGKDWEVNKNLDRALDLLKPVKSRHGDSLSWADLIVLAGNTALELSSTKTDLSLPFCPGRTDDTRGTGWEDLQPRKCSLYFYLQVDFKWIRFLESSSVKFAEQNNNELSKDYGELQW